MREDIKRLVIGLLIFAAIAGLGVTLNYVSNNRINRFLENRGEHVASKEMNFVHIGPFWAMPKGSQIYKITTVEGHTYWFRLGTVGMNNIYEEVDGKYQICE